MGFSIQEYWNELSVPLPWDFLTQESNPCLTSSALAGGFFTTSTTWEALIVFWVKLYSPKMEAETLTSSSGKSDHVWEIQSLQI